MNFRIKKNLLADIADLETEVDRVATTRFLLKAQLMEALNR